MLSLQRRESEFDDYLREKYVQAKAEFRELLKETKLITYNSRTKLQESDSHMNDIIKILEVQCMSWLHALIVRHLIIPPHKR